MTKNKIKNPPWSREELILALELYINVNGNLDGRSKQAKELAQELYNLSIKSRKQPVYRNSNGVAMKIGNFRRFDPTFTNRGRKGLVRGSKLEEEIWHKFANDPSALKSTAAAIRSYIVNDEQINEIHDTPGITVEAEEGRLLTKVHKARERDPKLAKSKKETTLEEKGKLVCEACGFDFKKTYGERGVGFIECHHIKPLSSYKAKQKTKLEDLALVCSNCHRMIHAKKPWLTNKAASRNFKKTQFLTLIKIIWGHKWGHNSNSN